jgi:uncharacterized protein YbaR (Trm112 family)
MSPQVGSIACPVCRNPLNVPVENMIDAERQPELKIQLLQGTLNAFRCPKCGNAGVLATPMLYHDGSKQLLFALTPANMNVKATDSQKMIGTLTNALMNSLPPEKRKAYLFQPKTFLTLESMVQAILEADGITKEMLDAQKAKARLFEDLLAQMDNDDQFKQMVTQNEALLDDEFFDMLTSLVAMAQNQGDGQGVNDLLLLRQRLLPMTKAGQGILEHEKKLKEDLLAARAELLQRVVDTEDEQELEGLVRAGRPFMDYAFFQSLADRIEATGGKEGERLTKRRAAILAISEKQDESDKKLLTERVEFLKRLLQSKDPIAAMREQPQLLDEAFFTILTANVEQAARAGQKQAVAAMQRLGDEAMKIIRENAPPAIKLINRLFEAQYPDETLKLLTENKNTINDEFIETLRTLLDELQSRGQVESVARLHNIVQQVEALFPQTSAR